MLLYVSLILCRWFNNGLINTAHNVQHKMLKSDPLDIETSILVIDQWRLQTRA